MIGRLAPRPRMPTAVNAPGGWTADAHGKAESTAMPPPPPRSWGTRLHRAPLPPSIPPKRPMPNDPAQDRSREKVLISPRYLAASLPSDHHQLLDVFVEDSAWSVHTDDSSLTVTSPCRRITIRHDQTAVSRGPHLVISARTEEQAPERWRTNINGNVPIEFVSTLIGTLAAELAADPDHVVYGIGAEQGLFELYVDIDSWSYFDDFGLSGFISHDGHATVVGRPRTRPRRSSTETHPSPGTWPPPRTTSVTCGTSRSRRRRRPSSCTRSSPRPWPLGPCCAPRPSRSPKPPSPW